MITNMRSRLVPPAETIEEIRQPVLMQAAGYQQSGNHGA